MKYRTPTQSPLQSGGDPAMIIKTSSFFCLLVRGGYILGDVWGEGIILCENPAGHFFPSMRSAIKRGMGWDMIPVAWDRLALMPVPETD